MFDEEERQALSGVVRGLVGEIRKLREELRAVRTELDQVEQIMAGHIDASGNGGRSRSQHRSPVSDELRAILAKGRGA
jgi:hypothetical protein